MKVQKFKQTEIGLIPEDWDLLEIGNVAEVIGGGTPSTKILEYWDGDIAWITPKDLSNNKFRYIGRGERNITNKGLKDSSAKLIPRGAVFLTTRAPVGYLAIANNEVATNQGFRSLIPNNKTNSEFLFYLLKKNVEILKSNASGTTFGELSGSRLKKLKFAFPKIMEQQAIAKILSDLDSKIELNQQMNQILEELGRIIFKRWFIDFEFPNEEGKPYKISGGKMINSELGKIPEGWRIKKLGDYINVERGLSYKGDGLCEKGTPLINLGNIAQNNHFRYEGLKFYSGNFKERNLVKPGDLIIANTDITQKREVLGSCLIVPSDLGSDKLLFTHHIYAVRFLNNKEVLAKHFLSYLLQTKEYRERVEGFATGTTVLALPNDAILNFNFVIPPERLLKEFDRLISYIKEKSSTNIIESKSLTIIHDSLLPKLMSGKIRVK